MFSIFPLTELLNAIMNVIFFMYILEFDILSSFKSIRSLFECFIQKFTLLQFLDQGKETKFFLIKTQVTGQWSNYLDPIFLLHVIILQRISLIV